MKSLWLMYHDVYGSEPRLGVPASASSYHVSRQVFAKHLGAIARSGAHVCAAGEALARVDDADIVVITFDDGWMGSFDLAVPLLLERGWRATYYVTRDFVGRPHFGVAATLRAAAAAGMEIGVHGVTHRMLSALPRHDVVAEFRDCRMWLEDLLGQPVRHASLPGGDYTPTIAECAREAGLASLANSRPGLNRASSSPFDIHRLAVKGATSLDDVARWCRFDVVREQARWSLLQVPRRVLGMRNYSRLRRFMLGEHDRTAEVFTP